VKEYLKKPFYIPLLSKLVPPHISANIGMVTTCYTEKRKAQREDLKVSADGWSGVWIQFQRQQKTLF
jgi:hypothetical protein